MIGRDAEGRQVIDIRLVRREVKSNSKTYIVLFPEPSSESLPTDGVAGRIKGRRRQGVRFWVDHGGNESRQGRYLLVEVASLYGTGRSHTTSGD